MKEITILGLGYVGLPISCAFAKAEIKVNGIDLNQTLVNNLINGTYDYKEQGLNSILGEVLGKWLFISNKIVPSDTYIVTVQTPTDRNHKADNSYVISALKSVAKILKVNNLVILESTVPIGSNQDFLKILVDESGLLEKDFHYCYCPESILPGNMFFEISNNNRVIGSNNEESFKLAKELYDKINISSKSFTSIKTAEFIKLVQNTHRDIELAFVNELSMICEQEDVNVFDVIDIANNHPRCNLLQPGSGVGGHCIAVDPYFLIERYGESANLISVARQVNNNKPIFIANQAIKLINGDKSKIIAVLGLSYKVNSDDCRESSGLAIANYLAEQGYNIFVCEPNVKAKFIEQNSNVDIETALTADCLIIAQKHKQFINIKSSFENIKIVDAVNIMKTDKN